MSPLRFMKPHFPAAFLTRRNTQKKMSMPFFVIKIYFLNCCNCSGFINIGVKSKIIMLRIVVIYLQSLHTTFVCLNAKLHL